jgi:hypothetical protein
MQHNDIVKKIIEEQSLIIGKNLAWSRAVTVSQIQSDAGEAVTPPTINISNIQITGDPKEAIDKLIQSYAEIFGQTSVNVCLDVLKKLPYSEIEPYLSESVKKQLTLSK